MNFILEENSTEEQCKITFLKAFMFILPLGFILHFLFLVIFLVKGVIPLAIFNIISCTMYIYVYFLGVKKHFYLSVVAIFFEILIHSILCCYFIGWTAGFYVYPLCLLPITYFVSINVSNKYIYGHLSAIIILTNYQFWNIYNSYRIAPYQNKFQSIDKILYNINTISACCILIILLYSLLVEMKYSQDLLKRKNEILNNIANYDILTTLRNRRSMIGILDKKYNDCQKIFEGFFIAIADIDNFKKINDTYGHDCGDIVLKEVSKILKTYCKENLFEVARWGGEEFLFLIQTENKEKCIDIIKNILYDIRNFTIIFNNNIINVTLTVGLSYFGDINNKIDDILKKADENLYIGKKRGKDCFIID